MGIWAGIKYALNSTIGTSEFEPLDKIIKSQKSLIKSDNLYYSFPQLSFELPTSNTEVVKELAIFKWPGSFKLQVENITGGPGVGVYAPIYINGLQLHTPHGASWSVELNVNVGDVLSIGVYQLQDNSKYNIIMNNLGIYANLIDNSAIKLL